MERVATKPDIIPLQYPVRSPTGEIFTELAVSPGQVSNYFAALMGYNVCSRVCKVVVVPIMSIQRMDSIWPDGDVFRPERWLEEDVKPRGKGYPGWSNLLVFSDGPRNCIGMRLGGCADNGGGKNSYPSESGVFQVKVRYYINWPFRSEAHIRRL